MPSVRGPTCPWRQEKYTDARYYEGSVKALLEEIQPDVVVSLLNAQCQVDGYFGLVD